MPDGAAGRRGRRPVGVPGQDEAACHNDAMPPSLCDTCAWMRETRGKLGQRYLLCRNPAIGRKYLPQPVLRCGGWAAAGAGTAGGDDGDPGAPGSVGGTP